MKLLLALALSLFMTTIHAATATYSVTLAKGKTILKTSTVLLAIGQEAKIANTTPFHLVGGCARDGDTGHSVHVDGTGQSGQTITVKATGSDTHGVTAVLNLANAEYTGPVTMLSGDCRAQTPAMLKWDASVTFAQPVGGANEFTVGNYTVKLQLVAFEPDQGTTI